MEKKIKSAVAVIKARVFNKRTPLVVGWALTNSCNLRCEYCDTWNYKSNELTTKQIFSIIDELADLGCVRISFTGGEPLLRRDISKIVDYTKKKNIFTGMSTNGFLVKKKIKQIKNIDLLVLSLDGPEKIHDFLRGKNSYKKVIEAITMAKKYNIKTAVTTVLTKYNLDSIDFILEKARQYNFNVYFQPVINIPLSSKKINTLAPSKEEYREKIKRIIKLKRKNKYIGNSSAVLKYLLNWPYYKKIKCRAGQIYCAIDPEGYLYACSNLRYRVKGISILEKGFKQAFTNLKSINCKNCWCASPLELNYLLSFNVNAIYNVLKKQ